LRAENGRVFEYEGGFDYYDWKYHQELEQKKAEKTSGKLAQSTHQKTGATDSSSSKDSKRNEAELRNLIHKETSPIKREVEKLEEKLKRLESEKISLEKEMAHPDFYNQSNYKAKLQEFGNLEKKIEQITEQWLEKQEELEQKIAELSK
jgi:ATP-binding cassette subfamily F protein 3